MYCNKCGKHIDEDSIFCQYCGNNVAEQPSEIPQPQETSKEDKPQDEQSKKAKDEVLWEKFVEVYDADGEARQRFNALCSEHIWELLERLSVNRFESFLEENKTELNKQPYKTIETLKNVFNWTGLGGYRLWLAEALLDDKEELNKFKSFTLDNFIDKWKEYDFEKAFKDLSEEMGICISRYSNFRLNNFMENAPEAKELSNATVEALKTAIILHAANGYHAGKIENNFRK